MRIVPLDRLNKQQMRDFIRFPWQVYKCDSFWVPPLLAEIRDKLDERKNPFFKYGKIKLFLAYGENKKILGRVAAIINPLHEKIYNESAGFFGMFECTNDVSVARDLFAAALENLKENDCTTMIGPVNFTTNDESGLLLEGNADCPSFMSNYCPSYYHTLLTESGFSKSIDTLCYETTIGHKFPDKFFRVKEIIASDPAVSIHYFRKNKAIEDILLIRKIYNESFKGTWGFIPMTDPESEDLAEKFMAFADFKLIWIACYEGKPAGMILAIPDINEIIRKLNGHLYPFGFLRFIFERRHLKRYRVVALGILPEYRRMGIETLLIHKVRDRMYEAGYQRAEFSVVMENNKRMRNLLESFGFRLSKRYRLYKMEI